MDQAGLVSEIVRRRKLKLGLSTYLFDQQRAFVQDPAPYKTACCSRRAGKTRADATALFDSASTHKEAISLYITLTRKAAKTLGMWDACKVLNQEYNIGGVVNESDLTITLPNTSKIILTGAVTKKEVDKNRGGKLARVVIDEAQSFPNFLQELVDDVLSPALADLGGDILMTGTPSPVQTGYFWDCVNSPEWSHHHWTLFDNPYIKDPEGFLKREMKRRGLTSDHPSILREYKGLWAYDPDSLVLHYTAKRNDYDQLPVYPTPWHFIMGLDLGYDDADAISVLAHHERDPNVYLVEEHVENKLNFDQLMDKLTLMIAQYKPYKLVIDTGGGGKKIAETIKTRVHVPVEAAEKTDKVGAYAIMDGALQSGRLKARRGSKFASDCNLLEWDHSKSLSGQPLVSDRFHSDIIDSVLYALRHSPHWKWRPPEWEGIQSYPVSEDVIRMSALMKKEQREIRERVETHGFDFGEDW